MEYHKKDFSAEFELKEIQPDGTFTGFASTFGGKPDSYGDVIVPGAFTETLSKNGYGGNGIKMLWQHDTREPIGVWLSLAEEKKGLKVHGQIAVKTTRGSDAYELLKIGAINSMSIGFSVGEYEIVKVKNGDQVRLLKKIDLYEVSLVTFSANLSAIVTGVKGDITMGDISEVKDVRQAEQFLRDVGFSAKASKYLISVLKKQNDFRDETSIIETLKSCKDQLTKLLEE